MFCRSVTNIPFHRSFHASVTKFAADTATATKLTKDQLKRRELRKAIRRVKLAKTPATQHPLYMPISQALRFLRAAEVGYPLRQQTITLTTIVVGDRGSALLSGKVNFPHSIKETSLAVFTTDEAQAKIAREQFNCEVVGGVELIEDIKNGVRPINFDAAFATPDILQQLSSKLGRTLGPRGLLPSAKKGTVATDLTELLTQNKNMVPFRQRGNCISLAIGNASFSDKEILENILSVQQAFKKAVSTQATRKSSILGKTTITTVHGPGCVIDFK
ncbi:HBR023Cp [Eremothecium sinecaudum]|uniref:HBR023Cp n=1 Tax=Eremothecium sinecaudum TaxID=45286 RepID=A0A109UWQ5_9SACH|nr:HBR023Cp [Eremothecium sinecaudum]AMD18924.1 HBR023Cp [Eremothecium sinecaudum]